MHISGADDTMTDPHDYELYIGIKRDSVLVTVAGIDLHFNIIEGTFDEDKIPLATLELKLRRLFRLFINTLRTSPDYISELSDLIETGVLTFS